MRVHTFDCYLLPLNFNSHILIQKILYIYKQKATNAIVIGVIVCVPICNSQFRFNLCQLRFPKNRVCVGIS